MGVETWVLLACRLTDGARHISCKPESGGTFTARGRACLSPRSSRATHALDARPTTACARQRRGGSCRPEAGRAAPRSPHETTQRYGALHPRVALGRSSWEPTDGPCAAFEFDR